MREICIRQPLRSHFGSNLACRYRAFALLEPSLGCVFERLRRLLATGLEELQAAKQLLIEEAIVPLDIVMIDWELALHMQQRYFGGWPQGCVGWPQPSVDWAYAVFNDGCDNNAAQPGFTRIVTMAETMVEDIASFNQGCEHSAAQPVFWSIVTMDKDIAAELLSKATQGLSVVRSTIHTAEWTRDPLVSVIETLSLFTSTSTAQHWHWDDDLELRSANALRHVDQLLLRQMSVVAQEELKMLQMILQDVALLACSRGVDATILRTKGIRPQLLARLVASFKEGLDNDMLSRLGNSKYHCFTDGVRFGERKHRRGCRYKREATAAAAAFALAASSSASPADIGQPPPTDLDEPIHHVHSQAIAPPDLSPPSDLAEPISTHCGFQEKIADVLKMHKVYSNALLGDILKTIPR